MEQPTRIRKRRILGKSFLGGDNMEEIWKDIYFTENNIIYDYRNLYQISNMGNIKKIKNKEKLLKPQNNGKEYIQIYLSNKNGYSRYFKIHRLVAHMFVDEYFDGAEVDHINTIKTDNRAENLRWVTRIENRNNPLTVEHFSESNSGENHWNYGNNLSDEIKQKISESHKGKHLSGETKQKLSEATNVVSVDLTDEFTQLQSSYKESQEKLSAATSTITTLSDSISTLNTQLKSASTQQTNNNIQEKTGLSKLQQTFIYMGIIFLIIYIFRIILKIAQIFQPGLSLLNKILSWLP